MWAPWVSSDDKNANELHQRRRQKPIRCPLAITWNRWDSTLNSALEIPY